MRMLVPFTSEFSIGHLTAGDYRLSFTSETSGVQTRQLNISKNISPGVDSLPYAAVSSADAHDVFNGRDTIKVRISGVLNSTCTSIDDKVRILDEGDVFVLLPTIKVKHGILCAQMLTPFEKEVDLGRTTPGVHLIHVRSMNGKSVNKVVIVSR